MANHLRTAIAAVFMLALMLPTSALAQEVELDLVLREVGEQMDHLREWVNDRLAGFKPREEKEDEPRPLGKTVSITVALEGTDRSATILTATSTYMLSIVRTESAAKDGEGHDSAEVLINAGGRIFMNKAQDGMLVTCEGSFMLAENSSREGAEESVDTIVNFETSALFRPGDARVIASQDGLALVLAVNIVPED